MTLCRCVDCLLKMRRKLGARPAMNVHMRWDLRQCAGCKLIRQFGKVLARHDERAEVEKVDEYLVTIAKIED